MKSWANIFKLLCTGNDSSTIVLYLLLFYACGSFALHFPLCTSIPRLSPIVPSDSSPEINEFIQQLKHNDITISNAERRIAVLPEVGSSANLVLVNNSNELSVSASKNGNDGLTFDFLAQKLGFFPLTTCGLRLETCVNCIIGFELEPVSPYFTELQIEKISNCDDPVSIWQPCFNFVIIEEKADRPLSLQLSVNMGYHTSSATNSAYYRRISAWDTFNNTNLRYKSTSSSLLVFALLRNVEQDLQLSHYIQKLFPIKITAYENKEVIVGHPGRSISIQTATGFVESPRFPEAYPRILLKNFTLVNSDKNGFVRLMFDDFHVHYLSELKILDSNGRELFNTRSAHRRPPALISSGNTITLIFSARAFTQTVGFRARYEFVNTTNWPDQPNSINCDEYLEKYGGRINMDNKKDLINTQIDCIWLIGRFPSVLPSLDQQIYLKVEEFQLHGHSLKLEIRRGSNSIAERVMMLFDEQTTAQLNSKQPADGILTSLSVEDQQTAAFYVRLQGFLTLNDGLSIIFAHFYRWAIALCPDSNEFHCDNSKCIKKTLRCDGYNHCGDFSDEICHLPDAVIEGSSLNVPNLLTVIVGVVSILLIFVMIIALASAVSRNYLTLRINAVPFFQACRSNVPNQNTFINHSGSSCPQTTINHCANLRRNLRGNGNAQLLASGGSRRQHLSSIYNNESITMSTPNTQTANSRRFFVLPPEHQISVIEAPPTYSDALKHPAVLMGRRQFGMYENIAYQTSLSDNVIQNNEIVERVRQPLSELFVANLTQTERAAQNVGYIMSADSTMSTPLGNISEESTVEESSPLTQHLLDVQRVIETEIDITNASTSTVFRSLPNSARVKCAEQPSVSSQLLKKSKSSESL